MELPIAKKHSFQNFGLYHKEPYDFAVFSWQSHRNQVSGYYCIYRFVTAAFYLSNVVFCLTTSKHLDFWFIYLSHIGLLLQTLHLLIAAAVPVQFLLISQKDGLNSNLTFLARFSWFLYNVTNLLSFGISGVFWTGLSVIAREPKNTDFLIHGINSIMTLCDIFISKRPCRILHFHHSLAVFLPYVTFSIIYWAAGGRRENGIPSIYPVLNWDNLTLTIPFVLAGLTFGVFLGHTLVWALHLLRDRVLRTYTTKDELVDKGDSQSQSNPGFVPDWILS